MMRQHRWLAICLALVAVAIAVIVIATASGSTTRGYTTALISKIGAGSDAVDQIIPVWGDEGGIQGISHAPGYYLDHQWVSDLEQGDLTALTAHKLTHLMGDATGDLVRAGRVRDQFKALGSQIAAQTVPAGLTGGLPDGSRQFVGDWNGYLSDAAKTVTGLREATDRIRVFIVDFATLAKRAEAAKAGGSLAPYRTALRRVHVDLRRISKLQALAVKPLLYSKHWTAIMKLTKSDQDANAIFQKVATRYPAGVIPGPRREYPFTVHHIS